MRPDPQQLRAVSSKTGFRVETLEKVIRLGEVMGDVAKHPLLSRVLVLKGGTAINLCFGEPRRLSVDLDFNYVGKLEKEGMHAERPEVERAIRNISEGRDYRIQESAEAHGGRKLYLAFVNVAGAPDRIEVDVNYLYREPLVAPVKLSLWQPDGFERPTARVVGFEELAGGKLVAYLDRVAPRDLYDTARLPNLDRQAWSSPRFRKIFIALSTVLPHPLHGYGRERMSRLKDRAIETELQPMLAASEHITARELNEAAWVAVEPLLTLSAGEKDFVDLVQRGILKPEELFGDDLALLKAVSRHPAILWKIENARKDPSRKP